MISTSRVVVIALIAFLVGVTTGISMYGAVRALAVQAVLIGFVIVVIFLVVAAIKR